MKTEIIYFLLYIKYLKKLHHFLTDIGIDRNNPIQRGLYADEHTLRGIISLAQGNSDKAYEEFKKQDQILEMFIIIMIK